MPADVLYLWRYELDLGAMLVVARATAERAERLDARVSLPDDAVRDLLNRRQTCLAGDLPRVLVHNKPAEAPSTRALEERLGEPLSSAMSLPLVVEDQPLGSLALLAKGEERFSEAHAALYALLAEPFYVALSNTLRYDEVVRLKDRLADDNRQLHQDLQRLVGDQIIGADFGLCDTMAQVHKVAPTDTPVLLLGETGVGKDVREIERVGGTSSIKVDIRIIAATNRDLSQMVKDGRFREDLWYRLNVFPIVVPPLRERKVDIAALVHHFIQRKSRVLKVGSIPELAPGAMDVLMAYSWPGNVRELENVVERAMILHWGEPLREIVQKDRMGRRRLGKVTIVDNRFAIFNNFQHDGRLRTPTNRALRTWVSSIALAVVPAASSLQTRSPQRGIHPRSIFLPTASTTASIDAFRGSG